MKTRTSFSALRWVSVFLILFAVVLSSIQIATYSRLRAAFPVGMRIADVPVGGLSHQDASQRVLEAYTVPIELRYNQNAIHLDPAVVGFELDMESMLAAADLERTRNPFWVGFWNYLWGRKPNPADIPLRASYSEARLRTYLREEVASRYDQPATPPVPQAGTVNFQPGTLGTELNIDRAIIPIENALRDTKDRVVNLPLGQTLPPHPSWENLEVLIKQTIDLSEFDGLTGFYLLNLQNGDEIHFAYQQGIEYPVQPDVAFTTASIIKIPILVSTYRRIDGEPDPETESLTEKMVIESGNEAADWLMQRVIHEYRSPLMITEDMRALGLENTFLAGHFYLGAPVLQKFETPANTREDINTRPDVYNQTTPSDIGMLLKDIYQCAEMGGGALPAVFAGEINQAECKEIVTYLTKNKMPSLLEAGLPEGTRIAHKHGWVTNNGIINLIGDAGIVYTPGGDYVIVVFLHHPEQLLWESSAGLVRDISRSVYNYFNLPTP